MSHISYFEDSVRNEDAIGAEHERRVHAAADAHDARADAGRLEVLVEDGCLRGQVGVDREPSLSAQVAEVGAQLGLQGVVRARQAHTIAKDGGPDRRPGHGEGSSLARARP